MTESPITRLRQQPWPKNRENGDFWQTLRAAGDLEPRKVICGFCAAESPLLDGPSGRAWFAHHHCSKTPLTLVKS